MVIWLEEFLGKKINFVRADSLVEHPWIDKELQIQAFRVDHCHDAFGFKLQYRDKTLVYSGDTRPCQALIDASRGVDLLIHECTMPDDLLHEAIERKHSAFSEVLQIIRNCKPQIHCADPL